MAEAMDAGALCAVARSSFSCVYRRYDRIRKARDSMILCFFTLPGAFMQGSDSHDLSDS